MSENLEAYFGLPNEVKFCTRCVISNQRPNSSVEFKHTKESKKKTINFDSEGVCDACRHAENKYNKIDWTKREEELYTLLDKYRKTDGSYDILVPGSGGKDSVYASHILKYKYDMHPLTITWAPHLYTNYGWDNFQGWIHKGGLDNMLFTPNGKIHRLLTRQAFKNLLHPFQPFIFGQKNLAPKIAEKFDIPLVFYGENEAEYGNPIQDTSTAERDWRYFASNDLESTYLGGTSIQDLIEKHGVTMNDLDIYMPADPKMVEKKQIKVHYLGYYLKWIPQDNYYYSVENTGFKPNDQRTEGTYSKYNSIDDKTDPYHYWTTLIKFGIGRTTYDASQEIRNNHINRDEGVALVKRFDTEFPKRYFTEFLDYISMTEEEFWKTADKFRSPHIWKKENGDWKLRHTVWNGGTDD
ncbi:TPA: N-acetyl sugar amidotransferase [archaeon]|nr:N-acetyl sugar amidotransferase [Candidatus Undinarchaeales archaeon SRR5007147.bin71]